MVSAPSGRVVDEPVDWLVGLFRANVDASFHVAYRLLWNRADAHDVVQTAFLKAARARHQLHDPSKARSWLLSITYREALMVLRSRRDVPTDPDDLPEQVGTVLDPAEVNLAGELATIIQDAIDRLPDGVRTALILRDVEEVPMADVAAILGVGLSAAKMRVARARQMLRIDLRERI